MGDKGVISMLPGEVSISADGTISTNGALQASCAWLNFRGHATDQRRRHLLFRAAKTAAPATNSNVRQGMLESSNVNPMVSMVELVTAQRSAEMMQRALSMLHFQRSIKQQRRTCQGG